MGDLAATPIPRHHTVGTEIRALAPVGKEDKEDSARVVTVSPASVCSVSFHRDHATTVRRSQVENPTASHVENEYSQPPRNSQASAYPGKHFWRSEEAWQGWRTGHVITQRAGRRERLGRPAC